MMFNDVTVFNANDPAVPAGVTSEVSRMWELFDFDNGAYVTFLSDEDTLDSEGFPVTAEFLRAFGYSRVLMTYGW